MVDADIEYEISDVKRINIRYYLIKIEDKSYIIDFANPKDLRHYFFIYFPKSYSEFKIYDVSGDEGKYIEKPPTFFQNTAYGPIVIKIMTAYMANIVLFPRFLNIWYLTKDSRIVEYLEITLIVLFLVPFVSFLLLYFQRTEISLSEHSKMLVLIDDKYKLNMTDRIFSYYIVLPGLIGFCIFWGLLSSSYVHLLIFGIIIPCSVLFLWFSGSPSMTRKFHIIEKEEFMNSKE
jgi:hypothetical protein